MPTQQMNSIIPSSIELGPIPFNLFASGGGGGGGLVLFCRSGFEITDHHLALLGDCNRLFYVGSDDMDSYFDYAADRLSHIVGSDSTRISEKAKIVRGVGTRIARQLMKDPQSNQAVSNSSSYVENLTKLIFSSPMAVGHLFDISSADSYTFSHSVNVCTLCLLIGERMLGRNREDLWGLGMGGLLHDIGKTRVNQETLAKSELLSEEEMAEMRRHSVFSHEIIKGNSLPVSVQAVGRSHHERVDGSGYPEGLESGEIHPFARIAAVADVYDAITSERVYRKMRTPLAALGEMAGEADRFDQDAFDALLDVVLHNKQLIRRFRSGRIFADRRIGDDVGGAAAKIVQNVASATAGLQNPPSAGDA